MGTFISIVAIDSDQQLARKAIDADVLATSSLIMGREKGSRLLDGFENSRSLFITEDGQLLNKNPEG